MMKYFELIDTHHVSILDDFLVKHEKESINIIFHIRSSAIRWKDSEPPTFDNNAMQAYSQDD